MNRSALKMLIRDRAKYLGILLGISFASLLITQQSAIFVGLMTRTFSTITDLSQPDIWVMDPKVQFIDDVKPMQDTELFRVRSVDGVQWAVPLYKGTLRARLPDGNFQACSILGLDDTTLIGGPPVMIQGQLADLRRSDAVIADVVEAGRRLARPSAAPGGMPVPLQVGDTLELNDHRAVVVGICKVSRAFQNQPVLYTTYSRATIFAPRERKLLSFVLVKAKKGQDLNELCDRIARVTGLVAYTRDEFKWVTVKYYLKYTGIPVNIGTMAILTLIIGTLITGQMFYNFTLDNLRYFGALKAMGASDGTLLRMIMLQALVCGIIGYGIGVGSASLIEYFASDSQLAFRILWQQLVITASAVTLICILASFISIRKVMRLEPAVVFRS